MRYTVVLQPEKVGYSVVCPAVQGAVSQGDSLEESLHNIVEAIVGILEVQREYGEEVPDETPEIVAEEIRAILAERAEYGLPLTIETHEVEVAVEALA